MLLQPSRLPLICIGPAEEDRMPASLARQTRWSVCNGNRMSTAGQVCPTSHLQPLMHDAADRETLRATRRPAAIHHEHEPRVRRKFVARDRHHSPAIRRLPSMLPHVPSSNTDDLCKNPCALAHRATSRLCLQTVIASALRRIDGAASSTPSGGDPHENPTPTFDEEREYGTGSSRDRAAKGPKLLGVRAVIAKSFELINRSNLIGMGVLSLELDAGEDVASLGLTGLETFAIGGITEGLFTKKRLHVTAVGEGGKETKLSVTTRIDAPNEVDYFAHGGILLYMLRQLAKQG